MEPSVVVGARLMQAHARNEGRQVASVIVAVATCSLPSGAVASRLFRPQRLHSFSSHVSHMRWALSSTRAAAASVEAFAGSLRVLAKLVALRGAKFPRVAYVASRRMGGKAVGCHGGSHRPDNDKSVSANRELARRI